MEDEVKRRNGVSSQVKSSYPQVVNLWRDLGPQNFLTSRPEGDRKEVGGALKVAKPKQGQGDVDILSTVASLLQPRTPHSYVTRLNRRTELFVFSPTHDGQPVQPRRFWLGQAPLG